MSQLSLWKLLEDKLEKVCDFLNEKSSFMLLFMALKVAYDRVMILPKPARRER